MSQDTDISTGEDLLSSTLSIIEGNNPENLRYSVAALADAEFASLLESLPPEQRSVLWSACPEDRHGDLLLRLHDEVRSGLIDNMPQESLLSAVQEMAEEDVAEFIQDLPEDLSETILDSLEADNRKRVERVLSYEEGTAGRLMSRTLLSVRPDVTLAVVLRWLRRHEVLPAHTDGLMVVDGEGVYQGKLTMDAIVTGDPEMLVSQKMDQDAIAIPAITAEHDIAVIFDRRELVSIAVVDDEGVLLGRITFDDAVSIMRSEADNVLLKSAGLTEEEDLFAPALPSAKRRGVWLGVNLITVFLAAWVVSQFEEVLSQLVAIAILMPVVASMGGIAGSQTLTLTIRGMALDQIASGNIGWLSRKELRVGVINGVVWSVVVSLAVYVWFSNVGLALVIAAAMTVNLVIAALCGVGVPLLLKKAGADPALAGAVILTTVTDVIGFFTFLGLATVFLL